MRKKQLMCYKQIIISKFEIEMHISRITVV